MANKDIETIHRFVKKLKLSAEVGINYMKSWEREKMIRDEGIKEGIEQGIRILVQTCKELGMTRSEVLDKIETKYQLNDRDAEAYMESYWDKE